MLFVTSIVCVWLALVVSGERPSEDERVRLWHQKNVWPPNWQPESDGYRETMEKREAEIMQLTGADERWENWMQFVQARLLPKFTPVGFKLIQTPKFVNDKLVAAVNKGLRNWDRLPYEEGVKDSIYAPNSPKFIDIGSLAQEVLADLRTYHEDWVGGMKLRGTSAYGVRMYQNGSTIVMHNDKVCWFCIDLNHLKKCLQPQTHVISSIVHIAHQYDDDNEPWPIMIEDHNGVMHSVNLEAGQVGHVTDMSSELNCGLRCCSMRVQCVCMVARGPSRASTTGQSSCITSLLTRESGTMMLRLASSVCSSSSLNVLS